MVVVPIIMGSKADRKHGQAIADALAAFGVASEIRVASAHKSVRHLMRILTTYEADGRPKVYVTVAGRSNALSGMIDANVVSPVIACPPYSDRFGGADIFSSLRMPSGVAAGVVLEPKSAALLAAKILSLAEPGLREKVRAAQKAYIEVLEAADAELRHGSDSRGD